MIQATMPATDPTRRVGIATCLALTVIVAAMERGVIGRFVGQVLSVVLAGGALAWCLAGPDRLRRVSELYLWLAFILAIYHLQSLAAGVAERTGRAVIDVFRLVAAAHLVTVVAATWALAVRSRSAETSSRVLIPRRLAALLFIVGAVVFWLGARTFPGLSLQSVEANLEGHLWTNVNFLVANVITLAGLALLTHVLREAGDDYLSLLGLLFFAFGAVFWTLHLAFRMTILVRAAVEWRVSSMVPAWFDAWREWAALLFVIYSVLAYVGLAAYGGAVLRTGWLPRWLGWACIVAGFLAVPLGGLPLFIHVPLWLMGILMLTRLQSDV
jgi:hypothetical protein